MNDDGSDLTWLKDDDADDRQPDWGTNHQLQVMITVMMMMLRTNMIVRKSIMMTMQKRNTSFFCTCEKGGLTN
jgi:hypothetical protein